MKPDGSGDFSDLQVALDTVPDGSTLLVYPNEDSYGFDYGWTPVSIARSVTLVGVDGPSNLASIGGYYFTPAVVTVSAAADSHVVLANLYIWTYPEVAPAHGVEVDQVGSLLIDRCIVLGVGYPAELPMPFFQDPADGVVVTGTADLVSISDSDLYGGDGNAVSNVGDDGSDCHGNGTVLGCPGGDGLRASNAAHVVVSGSFLRAGDGGAACWGDGWIGNGCGDYAPTKLRGGDGGNGISGDASVSGSTLQPGAAGIFVFRDTDWGNGENGTDGVEISGTKRDLPDLLHVAGTPARGASITLSGTGFTPYSAALLFASTDLAAPIDIKRGSWYLAFPFSFVGAILTNPAGGFSLSGHLPGDPALVGVPFVFQAADLARLSEPELFVLREN